MTESLRDEIMSEITEAINDVYVDQKNATKLTDHIMDIIEKRIDERLHLWYSEMEDVKNKEWFVRMKRNMIRGKLQELEYLKEEMLK